MNTRGLTCLAAAGIGLAALTGCGTHPASSGSATGTVSTTSTTSTTSTATPPAVVPTAAALVKQMRATIAKATSFKVIGSVTIDLSGIDMAFGPSASPSTTAPLPGQPITITLDAAGTVNGSNLYMTISHSGLGSGTAIYIDGKEYFRGDAGYYADQWSLPDGPSDRTSSTSSPHEKYAGKWIVTDLSGKSASPDQGMDSLHTMKEVLDQSVSSTVIPDATVAKLSVTPIVDQGVPAYALKHGATELIIAADKAATLRYVSVPSDIETQKMRFSQWNDAPQMTAPTDAIPSSQIPGWPFEGAPDSEFGSGGDPGPTYSEYGPDSELSLDPSDWPSASMSAS